MSDEIDSRIGKAKAALEEFGFYPVEVSAREFFDYMTGPIFSDDPTTLRDVLGNEYIMIHELVEISEIKEMGITINKRVIVDSPKTIIYTAHFTAMEIELQYALYKRDTFWAKIRLRHFKESVLDSDPNLPEELRPKAEELYEKYRRLTENLSNVPLTL